MHLCVFGTEQKHSCGINMNVICVSLSNTSSCFKTQTASVTAARAAGRVHLCNSSCLLIPLTVTQVFGEGRSASALKESEDSGGTRADWRVYLFINRRFAPPLCLGGPFSPVSPPEVCDSDTFGIRSVLGDAGSHKCTHTHTHTQVHSSFHLALVLSMNE